MKESELVDPRMPCLRCPPGSHYLVAAWDFGRLVDAVDTQLAGQSVLVPEPAGFAGIRAALATGR